MTESSVSVLVIDDSSSMRSYVVAALEADGFEVTVAKDGLDALKQLAQDRPFKAIVTDVNMPNINGLEIVRRVRQSTNEQRKNTPIIIISTDSQEKDRERGMKLGANAYVTKPFKPEELVATLRQHLGQGSNS